MFFGFATTAISLALAKGPVVSSTAAIEMLKAGNARFVEGKATHPHQDTEARLKVAKGQAPFAIVLTCADSRLSPEVIFDQGLGDLFVLRVAGNIAEPGAMASVEYAVEHLGARLLVVLGHERCGAVKAAVDAANGGGGHTHAQPFSDHGHAAAGHGHVAKTKVAHAAPAAPASLLPALLALITPSVKQSAKLPGDKVANAVSQNVINTANKVSQTQPLKKFIAAGKLTVVGSVYDLDTGVVKNIFKGGAAAKAKCGCCGAVKK
ncbi:MAG TPA: carbonic anhydrase [Fimbriimonas sp.]|nr:carbonic anhydrase [Fimbriimonas sp.]